MAFLFEAWREGDGFAVPVDHVVGGDVAPMHRAPLCAVGMQLVEHVPASVVAAQAVRVVDPPAIGGNVELRVPAVVAGGFQCRHACFGE